MTTNELHELSIDLIHLNRLRVPIVSTFKVNHFEIVLTVSAYHNNSCIFLDFSWRSFHCDVYTHRNEIHGKKSPSNTFAYTKCTLFVKFVGHIKM